MKNITNNLIIIDLFLVKPKQPCGLGALTDKRREHIITMSMLYHFSA